MLQQAWIQGGQLVLPGRTLDVKLLKHLSEGCHRFCNDIQGCGGLLVYLQCVLKRQNIRVPDLQGASIR